MMEDYQENSYKKINNFCKSNEIPFLMMRKNMNLLTLVFHLFIIL